MPGAIIDAIPATRAVRVSLLVLLMLLTLVLSLGGAAGALAAPSMKVVSFHGYRLTVPRGWPVYDLQRDPTTCVRFNRRAVYLGRPSALERCPAQAAGRSEAILLELVSGRVRVITGAAGLRSLDGSDRPAIEPRAVTASAPIVPGSVYTGSGFDVCSTPSAAQMSAWGSSSYRAVGIYIGGLNMACAQPNLSPTWVSGESAAGWHLVPIYVGLQAPSNSCGCAGISPASASSEGQAAAVDAVDQAEALGLGPGNPVYFDMEGYARGATNSTAVLAFLASWTAQLHADGYKSGVYSSDDSGISDLVSEWGTGYGEPDAIWIANWNGAATTSDSNVPSAEWANNQRLHQYEGGHDETHGGVTLDIDSDYLDGPTAAPGSVVSVAADPAPSAPPTIAGSAAIGQTLTEGHGSWSNSPSSYTYQWEDCNTVGISCTSIPGADTNTYTVASSDVGHTIRVTETATNAGGTGPPATSPPTGEVMSPVPLYWLYTAYGNVYPGPGTAWYRSPYANGYRARSITGMAATADGHGYWLVGSRGGVYPYGDAASHPAIRHAHPIVGIVAAPGGGYWLYTAYGNLYPSAGTAWFGSPSASGFRGSSITAMAATADGRGYWLVDSAGRVMAYGDAARYAALWHAHPIVGIVAAPGGGYWLYTAYGNVYSTPGAPWYRSPYSSGFRGSSIRGMAVTPDGNGYWLVTRGGTVFAYGDAAAFTPTPLSHLALGLADG